MWKGIKVLPGGSVTVNNSKINHADIAIDCEGTFSFTSTVNITNNSCFGNNDIAVLLKANSPSYITHDIQYTQFSAPSLITPKSGQVGDYGILLVGADIVDPTFYFQIGNTSFYTGSTTSNYFHDLAIAVRAFE